MSRETTYINRVNAAINAAANFIRDHEGYRDSAYWDRIGRVWTIGYGQTQIEDPETGEMRPVREGDHTTEDAASQFVNQRVRSIAASIDRDHRGWRNRLSANALAALYDIAYNTGIGSLSPERSPNLNDSLDSYTEGNADSIVWREVPTYVRSGGQRVQGLVNRRNDAVSMWGPGTAYIFEGDRETQQAAEAGDTEGPEGPDVPVEEPVPQVTEPAPEGGPRIVINPGVFEDKRDALCVAFNEAFRVLMEMTEFEPMTEPTDTQRQFFADTAYANDELQLRRTILARIATLDTSVKDPTVDQLEETIEFLEMVMEVGAPQSEWEQQAVQRLHDLLGKTLEAAQEEQDAVEPAGVYVTNESNLAPTDQNLV